MKDLLVCIDNLLEAINLLVEGFDLCFDIVICHTMIIASGFGSVKKKSDLGVQ